MSEKQNKYSNFLEFIRFCIVGVIATIVDAIGRYGMGAAIGGRLNGDMLVLISVLVGFAVGVLANYILSNLFVYRNLENPKKAHSFLSFLAFIGLAIIGLGISEGIYFASKYGLPWVGGLVGNTKLQGFKMEEGLSIIKTWVGEKHISWPLDFVISLIVFIVSTLIVLIWNYISRKLFIYKAPKKKAVVSNEQPEHHDEKKKEEKVVVINKKASRSFGVIEQESQPEAKEKKPVPKSKVVGKYEVYPEVHGYKFRLKANNGEILMVSSLYKTRDGAKAGIETFKKNVLDGKKSVATDKNDYSQWRIFTPNDGRLIAAGEIYSSWQSANKALNSVIKFYSSDKIVDLEEIDEDEVREWEIDVSNAARKQGGKILFYIEQESRKWRGMLKANNGQILFVTDGTYSTKKAVISAIDSITRQIAANKVHLMMDKQGRYQFQISATTGAVLVRGESYSTKDAAISSAISVAGFIGGATVIDKEAEAKDKEEAE